MKFGDFHEFKNFNNETEKKTWWKGRLVKTKYSIRGGLFEPYIHEDTVGVVIAIHQTTSQRDSLEVHWVNNLKSNDVCTHDVYSSGGAL